MRVPRGYRRNDLSPTKGIDTVLLPSVRIQPRTVEMISARLRALTQLEYFFQVYRIQHVEMISARLRALTHLFSILFGVVVISSDVPSRCRVLKRLVFRFGTRVFFCSIFDCSDYAEQVCWRFCYPTSKGVRPMRVWGLSQWYDGVIVTNQLDMRIGNCYAISLSSDVGDVTVPTSRSLTKEHEKTVISEINIHVKSQEVALKILEFKKQKRGVEKNIRKLEKNWRIYSIAQMWTSSRLTWVFWYDARRKVAMNGWLRYRIYGPAARLRSRFLREKNVWFWGLKNNLEEKTQDKTLVFILGKGRNFGYNNKWFVVDFSTSCA